MNARTIASVAALACFGCGPSPRAGDLRDFVDDPGPGPDAAGAAPDATVAPTADAALPAPPCGQLRVTFRDFRASHPDMQSGIAIDPGIAAPVLGADGKPAYANLGATSTVESAATFGQWFRDTPGVNLPFVQTLTLTEEPLGTFTYNNQQFFPLDGLGFGNETNPRNYHFTSEIHTTFTYRGGEVFEFSGDDDVFVFVNDRLVIDLGGVHDPLVGTVDFDARAAELGLVLGETYPLDIFHAERHTVGSTFKMVTTIDCLVIS